MKCQELLPLNVLLQIKIIVVPVTGKSAPRFTIQLVIIGTVKNGNHLGLPRTGKKVWKMFFFPGQGKVGNFVMKIEGQPCRLDFQCKIAS